MAQTLCQRRCRQQGILTLAQIGVVEVKSEREHVNRQRVRECRFKETTFCLFVDPAFFDAAACDGLVSTRVEARESSLGHASARAFVAAAVECPASIFVAVL